MKEFIQYDAEPKTYTVVVPGGIGLDTQVEITWLYLVLNDNTFVLVPDEFTVTVADEGDVCRAVKDILNIARKVPGAAADLYDALEVENRTTVSLGELVHTVEAALAKRAAAEAAAKVAKVYRNVMEKLRKLGLLCDVAAVMV